MANTVGINNYSKIDERFSSMNNVWKIKFVKNCAIDRENKRANINKFISLLLKSFAKKIEKEVLKSNKLVNSIEIDFSDIKQKFVTLEDVIKYLEPERVIKSPKNQKVPWEKLTLMQLLEERNITCKKRRYGLFNPATKNITFVLKLK